MVKESIYWILAGLFTIASLLPLAKHQYWVFRVVEFARIQLVVIGFVLIALGWWAVARQEEMFWASQVILMVVTAKHLYVLRPYFGLLRSQQLPKAPKNADTVSILSVNVYQFNKEYQRLIDLVQEVQPDIFLTMESNQAWEDALSVLDDSFTAYKKIALENTYGMHFYTKLKVQELQVNYLVADDLPSLEMRLETTQSGQRFTLYGLHPPPPSPTEEPNSKERDGELLSAAKKIHESKGTTVVIGDFNTVAWSRSSRLFKKTSGLVDPREGRGFIPTFHTKYWFLRFPIDLLFHTTDVVITQLKTLRHIGSDHFPLYCEFYIERGAASQKTDEEVSELSPEEVPEVEEMIQRGKKEQGDRPEVVEEG